MARKIKATYQLKIINKEGIPKEIRRMVLTEAFGYTVNTASSKEAKVGYCLVCGKWFMSPVTTVRACSRKCRIYLSSILSRIRSKSVQLITRKFRKTPLYLFLYIAVREGYLPPEVLGEEKPTNIPTPLASPTDFVEAFGITAAEVGREIVDRVREILKTEKEREVSQA